MYEIIAIVGPTASGKTNFAIELALRTEAQIVSFDSRQFYRQMNIGTATPSTQELNTVKHHFIANLPLDKHYSISEFEKDALRTISQIRQENKNIILVGGSGLYLQALEKGLDHIPDVSPEIRSQIKVDFEQFGIAYLQQKLSELDPTIYSRIDTQNPHRMIRALEVCLGTQKPYSSFLGKNDTKRPFKLRKIGIHIPREILYERINHRVDQMISQGLENEVRELMSYRHNNALQTVGYREFFDYFDGKYSFEQTVELIKQNTRRYAKRQMTWFSKDKEVEWVDFGELDNFLLYFKTPNT